MVVCVDARIGIYIHARPRDWCRRFRRLGTSRVAWSTETASAKRDAWGVEGGVGWDGTTSQRGERQVEGSAGGPGAAAKWWRHLARRLADPAGERAARSL